MTYKEKLSKFRDYRYIGKCCKIVIVDIWGKIIDENPTKEELKSLKSYPGKSWSGIKNLSSNEKREYLMEFLRHFYHNEGRTPLCADFINDPKYPNYAVYKEVFGNWNNAIIETGLKPNYGGKKGNLYTDEELLKFLIQFYVEKGDPPTKSDFARNPKYPGATTYIRRFGNWQKALKIVGLDVDSMVRRGIIETSDQKGRLGEIFVLEHFKEIGSIDLSGENKDSPCDGICPKGLSYDVKTAHFDGSCWHLQLKNVNRDKIEWFYLLAFNKGFTKLSFAWRIRASDIIENIEKGEIYIGLNGDYSNNLENMKEYEITEKIKRVYEKWRNNLRKCTKEEISADARSKLKIYVESKKPNIKYDKNDYDGVLKIK